LEFKQCHECKGNPAYLMYENVVASGMTYIESQGKQDTPVTLKPALLLIEVGIQKSRRHF